MEQVGAFCLFKSRDFTTRQERTGHEAMSHVHEHPCLTDYLALLGQMPAIVNFISNTLPSSHMLLHFESGKCSALPVNKVLATLHVFLITIFGVWDKPRSTRSGHPGCM